MKIAFFTTSRAEFGIQRNLIQTVNESKNLTGLLFVGGSHMAYEHGRTIDEIKNGGFVISDTFDYLLNQTDEYHIAKSSALAGLELARIFSTHTFDMVCVLGDRYELIPIVQTAIIFRKPIIHLHGGEKTEGAIDEQIRNMITKASHLHFASADDYVQNILNMGENPKRVFNTGALFVSNLLKMNRLTKNQIFEKFNLNPQLSTVLMTYHPVTLENGISQIQQIENVFEALNKYQFQLVITSPNADTDNDLIKTIIKENVNKNEQYHYFYSLGFFNYHNLLPYCEFVIGNSSSGLIEVPYYKLPTINIGDRQKGRIRHDSVIDTGYLCSEILKSIEKATNKKFKKQIQEQNFKLGDGNAAEKIVEVLSKLKIDSDFLRK